MRYICHPKTLELLRKSIAIELAVPSEHTPYKSIGMGMLYGIELTSSDMVPERTVEQKWIPPASPSKFYEYGPEDEWWMRPAGLGKVIQIDKGPYILLMA